MKDGLYRIGIVGASSLLGKELADELENSLLATSSFVLLDQAEAAGSVTAAGEEAAILQAIEPGSFDRLDFTFFAGAPSETLEHWRAARTAGASLVDLTYALESQANVPVRSPLVLQAAGYAGNRQGLHLDTPAVVSAHPAAVLLGTLAARLASAATVTSFAATVFEPASEHGREAMDELHQQTVKLLSFESLPREQYDAQVAFNLLPTLGDSAQVPLAATADRIRQHYADLAAAIAAIAGKTPAAAPAGADAAQKPAAGLPALALQLVQVPVFHGYTASVLVECDAPRSALERVLSTEGLDLVAEDSDPPSNLSAAGQDDIMVRLTEAGPGRFWLWLAADNLKLAALNAIACALELRKLRPQGKVQ